MRITTPLTDSIFPKTDSSIKPITEDGKLALSNQALETLQQPQVAFKTFDRTNTLRNDKTKP